MIQPQLMIITLPINNYFIQLKSGTYLVMLQIDQLEIASH